MKSLVLACLFIILTLTLLAQTSPEWVWAHGGGSVNVDSGRGVSTDSLGNCYLTGWYNGSATFGPATLTSINNSNDVVVIKMNPAGELLWAASAGGSYGDNAYAITTRSNGISIITGEFSGTASFGGLSITSDEAAAAFVAAIDTNGQWLWAASVYGSGFGEERGYGIAADENGDCYVTGYIKGNAHFGAITLNTNSGDDPAAFVAKISSVGVWIWAVTGGGTNWQNHAQGKAVATDRDGHVYATGYFTNYFDIGLGPITSNGSGDIFVTCLNSNGEPLWIRGVGSTSMDEGSGIAADAYGFCYLTGYFQHTANFGTLPLTAQGQTDIFVARLTPEGAWMWVNRAGGGGSDQSKGIAADNNGYCYVAGYYSGVATFGSFTLTTTNVSTDIVAAKLDTFGNWEWAEGTGGVSEHYAMAVGCDNWGNCYVTGNYSNTVMFGDNEVTGNYLDIFIAKHSSGTTAIDDEAAPNVTGKSLLQNAYPNPFYCGQNVIIKTDIAKGETGSLSIYNLRGQKLAAYEQWAGVNHISFDSTGLAAGMYFYRLRTQTSDTVKKLVLLK